MGQTKKAFLMNEEWGIFIQDLKDEDAGQLIKAIYAMNNGDDDYDFSNPTVKAVFNMIKAVIISNNEAYEERCRTNRENANKRWGNQSRKDCTENKCDVVEPNANQCDLECEDMQSDKVECDCIQTDGDRSSSSSSSSSSSLSVKRNKKEKVFIDSCKFSESEIVQSAFDDFLAMRKQKKKPMTTRAVSNLKAKLNRLSQDEYVQADILDQSTFRLWEDVYPLKEDFVSSRDRPKNDAPPATQPLPDDDEPSEEWTRLFEDCDYGNI